MGELLPTDAMIEAALEAKNFVPNTHWRDGLTEGSAQIEWMIAEKMIAAALRARSGEHQSPTDTGGNNG
jgi:hypothetical protein